MYQRPKASESDEDLLKLQEEFFKNKAEDKFKPAATVVNLKQGSSTSEANAAETTTEDIQERLDNTFEDIPKNINIGNIVEKHGEAPRVSQFKFNRSAGFPQAKRRDVTASNGRGSLFSQHMKKLKTGEEATKMEIDAKPPIKMEIDSPSTSNQINLPQKSYIVLGEESDHVHRENVDILSKMSEQEILEERERLMSTMDPAIVAFLKSRRHHAKVETRQPSIAAQNQEVDVRDIETTAEILTRPDAEKWLNFDTLEASKLAWMKGIDIPKLQKDEKYEARFDFNGWLMKYTNDEINEGNRILYHHGEEPGRPGYTLQELFQLCRSSVNQQKIVALNTISNILQLQSSGIYDEIIDIPVEQIFFVIRFCLDENIPAILNGSIKAMRNLFYNPIDETCLDSLLGFGFGFVQPILAVDNAETEDDRTVNDQQLAESNLVKCLMRTDILIRIRYIFNTVKPTIETVVYCLEILTRLTRDSNYTMLQVYKCDGLIESIVTNFVPKIFKAGASSNIYGVPLLQAIKFLRVLSARSKTIAAELIDRYKVLDSIATYVSNEFVSANANGLKLQIESLNLWSTFAHYGLGIDYFKVLQPILIRLLEYHLGKTDATASTSYVIQAHTSAFLNLLSQIARHDYNSILIYVKLIIDPGIPKWCSQLNTLEQFSCGKLQIISSLLMFLRALVKHQPINVHLPLEKIYLCIKTMIESKGFSNVTTDIKRGSNILNNYETHKCSANFKYTEAAVWNTSDHVIPVIQTTSCIPFLCALSYFVEAANNNQLKTSFLKQTNVSSYLKSLRKSPKYYLTSNWYTRVESNLIINVLKMAVSTQKDLDTAIYYEIAVKALCIFNSEQKQDVEFLLKNIIFSPNFYPSEILMQNLHLNDQEDILKDCLRNIDDIFNVYIKVLHLKMNLINFTTNLSTDVSLGNIMPIDWIYSPIIALYSAQENKNKITENEQVYIITNCLRWVYIYESYFPELATTISPTDRFCRLACTFLGSDTLFLIPDVRNLLERCLKVILKASEARIDFDQAIHGLNNFQDFYTQLLEQYQGVSYGDKLFGNFILIPLAQRHNVKLRKTLWSEYAGIVQIFNLTESEIFCPIDLFKEPEETDLSLLQCYKRILTSGAIRKTSVLYYIADYHVRAYFQRKSAAKK